MLGAVVSEAAAALAVLLHAAVAHLAVLAGVHHAAHADDVAWVVLLCFRAGTNHAADDFVAGDHGELGSAPLIAHLVNIAVANTAIKNLDQNVLGAELAPLKGIGRQHGVRGKCGVALGRDHETESSEFCSERNEVRGTRQKLTASLALS